MKYLVVIFLAFQIFLPSVTLSSTSGVILDDMDKRIVEAFYNRCDDAKFTITGFPAITYSKDNLISCEIAKTFNPDKYNVIYAQLLSAYSYKNSIFSAFSSEASAILDQAYSTNLNETAVNRLIKGDFRDSNLFNNRQEGDRVFPGLKKDQLEGVYPVVGEMNALLLYASDEILLQKITNWSDFEIFIDHLIYEAKNLDPYKMDRAVMRLNDALLSLIINVDPEASFMSGALSIPKETREKILSLSSLNDNFTEELIIEIKRIEYSNNDIYRHSNLGSNKWLFDFEFNEDDINIFWAIDNLEKAFGGVPNFNVLDSIERINYFAEVVPLNYQKIVSYFEQDIIDIIAQSDFNTLSQQLTSLEEISPGSLTSNDDWLLKKHLLFLILHPQLRDEFENDLIKNLPENWFSYVTSSKNKITNIIVAQELLELNLFEQSDFLNLIEQVKSVSDLCGDIDLVRCKRFIREININYFFENEFQLTALTPVSTDFFDQDSYEKRITRDGISSFYSCEVTEAGRIWAKIGFEANFIPYEMVVWCPFFEIKEILNKPDLRHEELILRAATFPTTTGINFLEKDSVWTDDSLGLLPVHLNRGPEVFSFTKLPFSGINKMGMQHSSYDEIANMLTEERAVHAETDFLYTPPYSGLAKIYAGEGAYELAYSAQLENLKYTKESEFFEPFSVIIELAKVKYYSRKAGVPSKLLEQYFAEELGLQVEKDSVNPLEESPFADFVFPEGLPESFIEQLEFAKGYIIPKRLDALLSLKTEQDFFDNFSSILSLTDLEMRKLCQSKVLLNILYNVDNFDINDPSTDAEAAFLVKLGTDEIFSSEYSRLFSVCALSHPERISYEYMVDEMLLPILENSSNRIQEQRYLHSYAMIAEVSAREKRPLGVYAALIAAKYVFAEQMQSYNEFGSQGLREHQAYLEIIVSSIGSIIDDKLTDVDPDFVTRFATNLNVLAAGFHTPVLSLNTTRRMMKSPYFGVFGNNSAKGWLEFQRQNLEGLAQAEEIKDYIAARAKFSDYDYFVNFDNLYLAHSLETFLWENTERSANDYRYSDAKIFNFMYGSGNYFIQGADERSGLQTLSGKLPVAEIEKLKHSFVNGVISKELVDEACTIFAPIRSKVAEIWPAGDIYLVPSVNLLPIPPRLVFGSFCEVADNLESRDVILLGDLAAGFEYLTNGAEVRRDYHFLGLGNPQSAKNSGLVINLGDQIASRGISETNSIDLDSLAPLPLAAKEVVEAKQHFLNYDLFLNQDASFNNLLSRAEEVSDDGGSAILTIATHGFTSDLGDGMKLPSLLSADEGVLGLVHSNEVSSYNLSGSIVLLSACDTAAGFADRNDLTFTGFVQAFGDAGSTIVQASLWPVFSDAAKRNTQQFVSDLREMGISEASFSTQARQRDMNSLPIVYVLP